MLEKGIQGCFLSMSNSMPVSYMVAYLVLEQRQYTPLKNYLTKMLSEMYSTLPLLFAPG